MAAWEAFVAAKVIYKGLYSIQKGEKNEALFIDALCSPICNFWDSFSQSST
jgi:hypothetical protein